MTETPKLDWRKGKACGSSACVEVAKLGGTVYLRDSKKPLGPFLEFTPDEWEAFAAGVAAGDFIFD
jgi:hypothetical protein